MAPATSALALNLRATWARAYVRVVGSIREPTWIMSDAVFPALTMASYVAALPGAGRAAHLRSAGGAGRRHGHLLDQRAVGMGAQLYWEKQSGQLQLYFIAPARGWRS